ncbi:MAG: ABC transporter permease [Microbacteriaceae bacterium]|nr:ABC transporter permease [Microbacteriaceae bacterium]
MISQSITATAIVLAKSAPRRRHRLPVTTTVGVALLALLILAAIAAPLLSGHNPETVETARVMGAPNALHPFGSDVLGRDVLSRVLFGLRVSLLVALSSVAVATLIAVPLGLIAGYFGGWLDSLISRSLDMLLVLPALLLAITLIAIVGPGSTVAALAIAIIYLPILARVMRTSTLVVSRQEYVLGSRSRGASAWRILSSHVAPNAIGPVIVQASVLSGFALQLEAALSFLGLGTQPPTPSLGGMLADGRDVLTQAPWVEIYPGLAIALAVVAFSLLGDGLRRALDPTGVAS